MEQALALLLRNFPMPISLGNGSGVSDQVVVESLLVLRTVLPTITLAPELASHFLQDMTEKQLREAVVLVITHAADIYPSTNWIALLRTARQRWCKGCDGTGRTTTVTGYETRCGCRS